MTARHHATQKGFHRSLQQKKCIGYLSAVMGSSKHNFERSIPANWYGPANQIARHNRDSVVAPFAKQGGMKEPGVFIRNKTDIN